MLFYDCDQRVNYQIGGGLGRDVFVLLSLFVFTMGGLETVVWVLALGTGRYGWRGVGLVYLDLMVGLWGFEAGGEVCGDW